MVSTNIYFVFLLDIVHLWTSISYWVREDISFFLPKAQIEREWILPRGHFNRTDRMASGWHDCRNLWLHSLIQVSCHILTFRCIHVINTLFTTLYYSS